MATGFDVDKLPLIVEDSPPVSGEWEHVPYLTQGGEEKVSEPNNYSLLQEDYYDDEEDFEDEENGVKGVADVDFIPEDNTCIELQKG